jgi:ribosomal protein L12E/L44/L45/RPP1/RPP2
LAASSRLGTRYFIGEPTKEESDEDEEEEEEDDDEEDHTADGDGEI